MICWYDVEVNCEYYGVLVCVYVGVMDLFVLFEIFFFGFSNDMCVSVEIMDGVGVVWLCVLVIEVGVVIIGSLVICEGDIVYNCLLWVMLDGDLL